jgi:hypothetical protein
VRPVQGSWWTIGLVVVLLLSQAVWVGGLVVITVVARVTRRILSPQQQVDFFKALGRTYAPVGGVALVLALLTGSVLANDHPWNGPMVLAALVAAALVVVTTWASSRPERSPVYVRPRSPFRIRWRAPGCEVTLDWPPVCVG